MPFTHEAFFDVFAAYNTRLWPFALLLWLVTAYAFVVSTHGRRTVSPFILAILTIHWAWVAVAYHAAFFSRINPAAWMFSGMFLVEAGLLLWQAVGYPRRELVRQTLLRQGLSWGLIAYALLYPVIVHAEGHVYPRLPTFGVPCPTTILTIGFLLGAGRSLPRGLAVIPFLWAMVAGSSALLLGVRADLMLLGAAIALAVDFFRSPRSWTSCAGA